MPYVIKPKAKAKPPWYHYRTEEEAERCWQDTANSHYIGLNDNGQFLQLHGHDDPDCYCAWVVVWEPARKPRNVFAQRRATVALAKFLVSEANPVTDNEPKEKGP